MKVRQFHWAVLLSVLLLPAFVLGEEAQKISLSPDVIQDFFADKEKENLDTIHGVFDPPAKSPDYDLPLNIPPRPLDEIPGFIPAGYETPEEIAAFCRSSLEHGGTFEERIAACSRIMNSIVWETATGELLHYADWPREKKDRLNTIFDRLRRNERNLELNCPSPALNVSTYDTNTNMYLTEHQAFDVYAAQVAHILLVEIERTARRISWSILDENEFALRQFFDSRSYHSRILPSLETHYPSFIQANRDFQLPWRSRYGDGLNCDPRIAYQFVRGVTSSNHVDMVLEDQLSTLANLSFWASHNMGHGERSEQVREQMISHSLMIDRLRGRRFSGNLIIAAQGCQSATTLFYELARSINIPLTPIFWSNSSDFGEPGSVNNMHQGLVYGQGRSDIRVLPHTDSIYATGEVVAPFFPVVLGRRAMEAEGYLFFDANWVNPEELITWGFRYLPAIPLLTMESRLAGADFSSPYNNRENFGYFMGSWPNGMRSHTYEKAYNLCSWPLLLSDYCSLSRDDFLLNINNVRRAGSTSSTPNPHDNVQFWERARECVNAYGGCAEVNRLQREWLLNSGQQVGL